MIIKPKVRGFICTTTHPVGCEANVRRQIAYTKAKGTIENGPKKVLVIGASTGYGLASRIATAFGSGAATLGVFFEKAGTESKTGTAGWYNSAAFQRAAEQAGLYATNINGDAFSDAKIGSVAACAFHCFGCRRIAIPSCSSAFALIIGTDASAGMPNLRSTKSAWLN